jgi:multiple sugar transport system ATP-binding protein
VRAKPRSFHHYGSSGTYLPVKEKKTWRPSRQRNPSVPGGTRPAVDKLNLEVGDGEFLVLVGPSGCGKSTSLRMLAGLEEVNSGRILIGDRDVTDIPPKDRDIAMVFQNYALYPHMTVAENMGFALKIAGVGKEERAQRVLEAAKLLDLEDYLTRKPKALSAVSVSVSRWAARSCASPRCSSWTSRCRTSTRSCACRRAPRSRRCSATSASPPST